MTLVSDVAHGPLASIKVFYLIALTFEFDMLLICLNGRSFSVEAMLTWSEDFYNKASSAVFFNNSIGTWFRTTGGVSQGCLLSLPYLTYFWRGSWLPHYTTTIEHSGTVSIGVGQSPACVLLMTETALQEERRTSEPCRTLGWNIYSPRDAERCRKDQTDDKQYQRHQHWHQRE